MIRMLDGIWLRIRLIDKFEKAVTLVKAKHIIKATDSCEVTAKAEQTPRICKAIGLLLTSGSSNAFFASLAIILTPARGWRT